MYVMYDSQGKIKGLAEAGGPSPYPASSPGLTSLYLDDTEYADVWNNPSDYTIENNIPISTPVSDATKLENAQQAKIAQLGQALQNAIATFPSSAKGTTYTYLADEKSITMLGAEYAYVRSSDYKGETVNWYTKEAGRISHTGAEIAQVFLDGRAYVANQYAHHDNLVAQVNAITLDNQTLDQAMTQLNAITW